MTYKYKLQKENLILILIATALVCFCSLTYAQELTENGLKKEYYDDGSLKAVYSYKDGMRNGIAKTYFKSGAIKEDVIYKNNRLSDTAKKYYEDGTLHQEVSFKDGKPKGIGRVYNTQGELEIEYEYKDGALVKTTPYNTQEKFSLTSGTPKESGSGAGMHMRSPKLDKSPRQSGSVKEYYDSGELEAVYNYRDGIREGAAKTYFRSGAVRERVVYKNDRLSGMAKKYYEDGTLHQEAFFKDGVLEGAGKIYNAEGKLETEYEYRNGTIVKSKQHETDEEFNIALRAPEEPTKEDTSLAIYLRPPDFEERKIETAEEIKEYVSEEEPRTPMREFLSKLDFAFGYERSFLIFKKSSKRDEAELTGLTFALHYSDPEADTLETWVNMGRLDFRYTFGDSDHDGTQRTLTNIIDEKVDNVPIYIFEGRLLAGHNFPVFETSDLAFYSGIGYRYLSEDPSQKSDFAFRRESNCVYCPVGMEFKTPFMGWNIDTVIEFDGIIGAWERSHLSDMGPVILIMNVGGTDYTRTGVINDMTNDQNGYGVRGYFRIEKKGEWFDFVAEPFFSFWSIKDSKEEHVFVEGVEFTEEIDGTTYYAVNYVPKNNITEYGAKLLLRF